MLSKSLLKLIHSLDKKKYRNENKLFVAEGRKTVCDLLSSDICCTKILVTEEWLKHNCIPATTAEIIKVTDDEMQRASFLRTPQGIMGLFAQRSEQADYTIPTHSLCLALDGIQDPGNLGTIVRIADWFGIEHIFCSNDTADIYNPKAIQATMGAVSRVKTHYCELSTLLATLKGKAPIYGTFLDGENIYEKQMSTCGIIVMGNEGNGISSDCAKEISEKLFIPSYPAGRATSESLNVSTATAIICAEFRRREKMQ